MKIRLSEDCLIAISAIRLQTCFVQFLGRLLKTEYFSGRFENLKSAQDKGSMAFGNRQHLSEMISTIHGLLKYQVRQILLVLSMLIELAGDSCNCHSGGRSDGYADFARSKQVLHKQGPHKQKLGIREASIEPVPLQPSEP